MASTIFSSFPVSMGGLIPTFKFPNSAPMRSITPVSVLKTPSPSLILPPSPSPSLILPPSFEAGGDMINNMYNLAQKKATLKTPSPCLMLPPSFEGGGDMVYNMYNLTQNKVLKFNNKKIIPEEDTRIVGSSHGWLSLFNERNCDLILTNPVTGSHVKLPPSNSNISCYSKVILSSDAEQEDCWAMMINNYSRLAFCCPGRSPTEWTPLGALKCPPPLSHIRRCYADLVYSRRHNLFFCVTNAYEGDDFEAWDVASDPPRLRWENRGDLMDHYNRWLTRAEMLLMAETGLWCSHCTYLVFAEQMDQLFFVTRHVVIQMAPDGSAVEGNDIYPYKTILFDVHKLDWEFGGDGGRLTHLDGGSLDGLAMFVGLNHSFAVSASDANGLKPNSIYFTDDKMLTPSKTKYIDLTNYGGHDIGIFDYENKTISSCYYPCDLQNFKQIIPQPIWFTPTFN